LFIFDFGGVIGHFDIEHFSKFIDLNGGNSAKIEDFFKNYKSSFDLGKISECDFWTRLGGTVGINLSWKIISENNKKNLMIDYKAVDLIKKINAEKILLSNSDSTTVAQIRAELNLSNLFSEAYFSCELGKNKLDSSILNMICEKHKILPKEALLVDDFEGNIERASDFGFRTHLFKSISELQTEFLKYKII